MDRQASKIGIVRAVFEIVGIVLVRFRPLQRIWGTWLVAVNLASVLFIWHVEGLVAFGVVGVAVVAQALIYQRRRFVRILGVTHFLWVPMLTWMVLRFDTLPVGESSFRVWLILLIATNAVSLTIDTWDAMRFLLGERHPSYVW